MTDATAPRTLHAEEVPDSAGFAANRVAWRADMGADVSLRQRAVDLQIAADAYHHTYQREWLGVPVIRLPDDIVVLQEMIWSYRPTAIVETGVARGGSLILNSSLQVLAGLTPAVLGIDVRLFDHTRTDVMEHPLAAGIELLEADSASPIARGQVAAFLQGHDRALLVLDSNHTHEHVLEELRSLTPLLPRGSFVFVADTLIEEFPRGHYAGRPWDRGNNPMTAVREFLEEASDFEMNSDWSRRALVSEFRDGVLRKLM